MNFNDIFFFLSSSIFLQKNKRLIISFIEKIYINENWFNLKKKKSNTEFKI